MMDEPIAEMPPVEKAARLQRMKVLAVRAWHGLVDVITPPLCLQCQTPVTQGAALCLDCWQKLQLIDEPVCDVLGTPFAYDEGEGAISPAALADPPGWDKARAAVAFDDASRGIVHTLKYQDQHEAALLMARMMAGAGRNVLAQSDVIVPVPLHRRRLWQRRFNQAALLARALSGHCGVGWDRDVLMRRLATPSQVGLTADERRRNMAKAFTVPVELRPRIDGKTVVLVDDVRTTGATAHACARVLREAGAAQVFVLTFALVLQPARLHIEA